VGIQLYSTPSDPQKQQSAFYGWMKVGFMLFEALCSEYPLYREGQVGRHALEVFPHATAVALAGRHRPDGVKKRAWRKQILADQGYDVSGLRNSDLVDAALATVTAAYALRGASTAFGDPDEGVIVTALVDAADRFRVARGVRVKG
jgi:predicted RNase H-like nuclease